MLILLKLWKGSNIVIDKDWDTPLWGFLLPEDNSWSWNLWTVSWCMERFPPGKEQLQFNIMFFWDIKLAHQVQCYLENCILGSCGPNFNLISLTSATKNLNFPLLGNAKFSLKPINVIPIDLITMCVKNVKLINQ